MNEFEIQTYYDQHGEKFILFGLAKLMEGGKCIDHLLVYHPKDQPNILYAMKSKEFNKTFKMWQEEKKK